MAAATAMAVRTAVASTADRHKRHTMLSIAAASWGLTDIGAASVVVAEYQGNPLRRGLGTLPCC